jgi:NADPH:quinone reductase-like Zn-dependent oxidoreductase
MSALPAQMTAIAIRAPGGPDMLVPEKRPLPRPGEGEVLVKVAAAGVNRPDVMQRQGLYPRRPISLVSRSRAKWLPWGPA